MSTTKVFWKKTFDPSMWDDISQELLDWLQENEVYEIEVHFEGNYSPYVPAVLGRPMEHCSPEEPEEVEISKYSYELPEGAPTELKEVMEAIIRMYPEHDEMLEDATLGLNCQDDGGE